MKTFVEFVLAYKKDSNDAIESLKKTLEYISSSKYSLSTKVSVYRTIRKTTDRITNNDRVLFKDKKIDLVERGEIERIFDEMIEDKILHPATLQEFYNISNESKDRAKESLKDALSCLTIEECHKILPFNISNESEDRAKESFKDLLSYLNRKENDKSISLLLQDPDTNKIRLLCGEYESIVNGRIFQLEYGDNDLTSKIDTMSIDDKPSDVMSIDSSSSLRRSRSGNSSSFSISDATSSSSKKMR